MFRSLSVHRLYECGNISTFSFHLVHTVQIQLSTRPNKSLCTYLKSDNYRSRCRTFPVKNKAGLVSLAQICFLHLCMPKSFSSVMVSCHLLSLWFTMFSNTLGGIRGSVMVTRARPSWFTAGMRHSWSSVVFCFSD